MQCKGNLGLNELICKVEPGLLTKCVRFSRTRQMDWFWK